MTHFVVSIDISLVVTKAITKYQKMDSTEKWISG